MADALIDLTIVAKFGRERTDHAYRVAVVGDNASGYRAQAQTKCGRIFNETTKTSDGIVSCDDCQALNGDQS